MEHIDLRSYTHGIRDYWDQKGVDTCVVAAERRIACKLSTV